MGAISAGDLTLLRQPVDSQKGVERLYSLGYDQVWTGLVNDATITRGERSIVFDGGAMAGTFVWADLNSFEEGLEVWFGSTSGGQERGRRRVRSITSADNGVTGTLVVDWYDDFELRDDDFITIVHNYPAWPKYSWFTATGPAFRKDGPDGTLYSGSGDANETPAPHVIMGRHYAGEMPSAGNLTISFDATNTVDVAGGGGAVTYSWDITPPTNASFDNDAIGAPTMTVTAAGRWWVHVTVTIDGRSTTAHRAVIVGGGITEFERGPITTRWDSTSLTCQIDSTSPDSGGSEIRPQVDWSDFDDHALVIITADEYYGTTNKSIDFRDDAVYDDRHHIVFCGYLLLENDDFQSTGGGQVQMSVVSLMDMFVYSLSLTGVDGASQWYEMDQDLMTVAGNLLHLFRWQSTLLDIADWWFSWSDTVLRSANEEFGEGDIMERARSLARARIMGMTCNPQGEIFVETDLNTRDQADRAAETTTLTLTDADIAGDKRVRIRRRGDLIRVLLDGGYSQGRMGTFQPYFSASQEVARAEGRPALVHLDRLMLPSQVEANRLAGRLAAVANRKYAEVNLDFSGNYREIFSPADQQWTDLGNIFTSTLKANLRGFDDLDSVNAVPRQVTHRHDNRTGYTSVSVIFDVEAPIELEGVTITPPEVPSEDPEDGGWDEPDPPEWPPDTGNLNTSLVAFDDAEGCWMRFVDASDWEERNGSRTGTDDDDNQGGWDPWWFTPAKANTTNPNSSILWACQDGKIWRSTDGGSSWLDVTPADDPPDDFGQTPPPTTATVTFIQRTDNIHQNEAHYFLAEYSDGALWGGWLLVTEDDGVSWTWYSLADATSTGDGIWVNAAVVGSGALGGACSGASNTGNIENRDGNFATLRGGSYIDVEWCSGVNIPAGNVTWRWRARMTKPGGCGGPAEARLHRCAAATGPADIHWFTPGVDPVGSWYTGTDTKNYAGAGACMRIRMTFFPFPCSECDYYGDIDYFQVLAADVSCAGNFGEIRPIWMDTDSEDGTRLFITGWADDDNLHLWELDTSDFTATAGDTTLGACTAAQLAAKTYIAYPHTPPFNGDYVYVFGRMNAPQGLANPEHVIKTQNGGGAWASVENGWGGDYCGAFRAEGTSDGARTFYAIRNIAAAAAKLYVGPETLTYRIDTSFTAGVYVDALTVNPSGQVAVGSDGTNDIELIESPWSAWTDVTDSYPGAATNSLTYI